MLFALPFPALAEAECACATATQLVAASSILAFPAFFRMLRPVRAGHWKWLLLHVWIAGGLHKFGVPIKMISLSHGPRPRSHRTDVECLHDDDLANDPPLSALQARVAGLETEQRAHRLAIDGAFLCDPHVDSD